MEKHITLYSYPTSPFAAKVHGYLLFKQLDFNVIYVNPTKLELPIGKQIPVITINEQHYADSSLIINKIDELFPASNHIGVGNNTDDSVVDLALVKQRDDWVTHNLIPGLFRNVCVEFNAHFFTTLCNAFKAGATMNKVCGISKVLSLMWPIILPSRGFIVDMVKPEREKGSATHRRKNALQTIDQWLDKTEFLASNTITHLDTTVYSLLAMSYYLGMKGADDFLEYENIKSWMIKLDMVINKNQTTSAESAAATNSLVPFIVCQRKSLHTLPQ